VPIISGSADWDSANERSTFFEAGDSFVVIVELGLDPFEPLVYFIKAAVYIGPQFVEAFVHVVEALILQPGSERNGNYDWQRDLNERLLQDIDDRIHLPALLP
jgi:hypothetical protein